MGKKSKYELKLEEALANSKPFYLSEEENFQAMKDLSEGMEEFLLKEKNINAKTMIEAKSVIVGKNTSI